MTWKTYPGQHGLVRTLIAPALAAALLAASGPAAAHDQHTGGIQAAPNSAEKADFDIVHAKVTVAGNVATFHMAVSGRAGDSRPAATGQLAGAEVFAYVWPTGLDASAVGFDQGAGILSLAVTAHPDFDDTPLFDENGDGDTANDGDLWHSHWVVLGPDEACGAGALKVLDIPAGATPNLPKTWPGLPILIDSPGWQPLLSGESVDVKVPFAPGQDLTGIAYDGVTSGLRVNANVHAPLLCVTDLFDVASGDLSLSGRIGQ